MKTLVKRQVKQNKESDGIDEKKQQISEIVSEVEEKVLDKLKKAKG